MGLGRFLNKRMFFGEGLAKGGDSESPAVILEDGKVTLLGGTKVGDGGGPITNIWQVIATINLGAIGGLYGTANGVIGNDVAMSGAAVGDVIVVSAIGSLALGLDYQGACYSANAINVRCSYLGTTGAYTPGNVPFKITCIKI